MSQKDGIRSGSTAWKGAKFLNRNIFVFAFFLFLSFAFWYLNSLSKVIETDIRYPVVINNLPKDKSPVAEIPDRVNLVLSGPGYSILKQKLSGDKVPLAIDFRKSAGRLSRNGKPQQYFIVSSGLIGSFNSQLKTDCKILTIKPDTIYIALK